MAIIPNADAARNAPQPAGAADVDVVLLAGTVGHESGWVRNCPRPALPLPGTSIVRSLVSRLQRSFDGAFMVCSNGHTDQLEAHLSQYDQSRHGIRFHQDAMPRGTAGCLKAFVPPSAARTMFVVGGAVWLDDDPAWMVEEHRAAGNALTVFCTADGASSAARNGRLLRPAGVYCCEPIVLEHIKATGYQDIKEQLVPALRRAGLRVGTVVVPGGTREVSDWSTYLSVVGRSLARGTGVPESFRRIAPDVYCGSDVEIAPTARIVGPVMIGSGCRIDDGAVVIGPTVLGDGCRVGDRSWLVRVITADGAVFPAGSGVVDDYIAASDPRTGARSGAPAAQGERAARGAARIANGLSTGWRMRKAVAAGLAIVGLFVWAFDATLANLWHVWQRNPDYSSGQLVPLCVLYMVMTRRESLRGLRIGMWPVGLLVFLAGITMHALGGAYAYSSMEYLGMVVCANGVAMSLIGRAGTRKLWYPLVFLFLMLPLPHRVHTTVMLPLQTVCAQLSETILETVGIPVARFGHVLEVEGYRVAVAEACSGLRMALAFLIVTGVVAFVVERPMWQKMIVVSSSIPIALACNVLRIVSAAYLYSVGYPWLAQGAFHDGAGLLMMPVALLLIFLEFRLLSNLAVSQQAVAALVERVDRARVASSG